MERKGKRQWAIAFSIGPESGRASANDSEPRASPGTSTCTKRPGLRALVRKAGAVPATGHPQASLLGMYPSGQGPNHIQLRTQVRYGRLSERPYLMAMTESLDLRSSPVTAPKQAEEQLLRS